MYVCIHFSSIFCCITPAPRAQSSIESGSAAGKMRSAVQMTRLLHSFTKALKDQMTSSLADGEAGANYTVGLKTPVRETDRQTNR